MSSRIARTITFTTVPGNSAYIVPLDTTRLAKNESITSSIAAAHANLAPGSDRGRFAGWKLRGTVECTGQNVTILEQGLTGVAGTYADWATDALGTISATTAAPTAISWDPVHNDFRIAILAGATGPTTITVKLNMFPPV